MSFGSLPGAPARPPADHRPERRLAGQLHRVGADEAGGLAGHGLDGLLAGRDSGMSRVD
jgi:hypothetical protein